MENSFEKWLETTKFWEEFHGADDDMPDAFSHWLANLDIHEWLAYGQEYAEDYADLQKSKRV